MSAPLVRAARPAKCGTGAGSSRGTSRGCPPGRGWPPGQWSPGITGEYPLVRLTRLDSRLGAEFLDQQAAGVLVGGQRLGTGRLVRVRKPASAAHAGARAADGHPVRPLQLGDHVGGPPQVQVRLDAAPRGLQPHLRPAGGLPARPVPPTPRPPAAPPAAAPDRPGLPGRVPPSCPVLVAARAADAKASKRVTSSSSGLDADDVAVGPGGDPGFCRCQPASAAAASRSSARSPGRTAVAPVPRAPRPADRATRPGRLEQQRRQDGPLLPRWDWHLNPVAVHQ